MGGGPDGPSLQPFSVKSAISSRISICSLPAGVVALMPSANRRRRLPRLKAVFLVVFVIAAAGAIWIMMAAFGRWAFAPGPCAIP